MGTSPEELIEVGNQKPPEPVVRVGQAMFFFNCALTGLMIGHGLGLIMTNHWQGWVWMIGGLVQNIGGFVLRGQTRKIEIYEAVERIVNELKAEFEKTYRK